MASLSEGSKIRRYSTFDQELQKINREYISPPSSGDDCKQKFMTFWAAFKSKLREIEPLLNDNKLVSFVGSSYDGTYVGKSYKDFDVNIHIKLGSNLIKPTGIKMANIPGFVTLRTDIENYSNRDHIRVYNKWLDAENYINPIKFYRWGESAIDRTLCMNRILRTNGFNFEMTTSKFGVGFSIHVKESNSRTSFDVNVVFALSFDKWHPETNFGNMWIAIPKQPTSFWDTEGINSSRHWMYSFYEDEKNILRGLYHFKNAIRFIKHVRDSCNMSYLGSYCIKTLFMWEVMNRDISFWEKSLGYVFVEMLYKLRDALNDRKINFYFDERYNLLSECTENQILDGVRRLSSVISSIEKFCDQRTPHRIREVIIDNAVSQEVSLPSVETVPRSLSYSSPTAQAGQLQQETQESSMGWLGGFGIAAAVGALAIAAIAVQRRDQN